jgi:hypothetical protein
MSTQKTSTDLSTYEKEILTALYKVHGYVNEDDNYAITGFVTQLENAIWELEHGKRTPAKPVRKPSGGRYSVG